MNTELFSWLSIGLYFALILAGIMTNFFNPIEYGLLLGCGLFVTYIGITEEK